MKRLIYPFVLVCAVSFLFGCGNDQFAIEKEFWHLQKQAKKIADNPDAAPPRELETAVNKFDTFAHKYPQNYLAIEAEFNIARLYLAKKDFDTARDKLNAIVKKHIKSAAICSEAAFLIGNSYELANDWGLALQQYKKLIRDYAVTPRGLSLPIYIAEQYQTKYQPDKMMEAYQEAITHYRELALKYPDSPLAYNAHSLVAKCYIVIKDWQNAINSLKEIIEKYKGKVALDGVLMNMAVIYDKQLNDKVKAREALEQLKKEYPQSRLVKAATALLKNQGVK